MTVTAVCSDCEDEHPLGDRPADWTTTRCPVCASTSYETKAVGGRIVKSEAQRIKDAVKDVHGVGDETVAHIVRRYSTYAGLEAATEADLVAIDNVGAQTAKRIRGRVTG